jgi:hypothetical protein
MNTSPDWTIPSGRTWDGKAIALGGDDITHDSGCVATRKAPDGRIEVADTKVALGDQSPLRFTER